MRSSANQGKRDDQQSFAAAVAAVCILVAMAMAIWLGCLLGEAIDREIAIEDARIEAHRASLVSK